MIKCAWQANFFLYQQTFKKIISHFCKDIGHDISFKSSPFICHLLIVIWNKIYGKCPKISNTKVFDKMAYANSVDPGSTLFAIPLGILGNNCIKSKIWAKR